MSGIHNLTGCQQIRNNTNLSILLANSEQLDHTCYKVLQQISGGSFLPVYRSVYNGQVKLSYDISRCTTVEQLMPQLKFEQLLGLFSNLISAVDEIEHIGFLRYEIFSLEPEDLFIDLNTFQLKLLYVPVIQQQMQMSRLEFEQYLRRSINHMISSSLFSTDASLRRLRELLVSTSPLEEIQYQIQSGRFQLSPAQPKSAPTPPPRAEHIETAPPPKQGFFQRLTTQRPKAPPAPPPVAQVPSQPTPQGVEALVLCSIDLAQPLEFPVTKAPFVLGKSADQADGFIPANPSVSRRHCELSLVDGTWFVLDLNSVNGTYLNGARLAPGKAQKIKPQDILQLSNVQFAVKALTSEV